MFSRPRSSENTPVTGRACHRLAPALIAALCLLSGGCEGIQSALSPAGRAAEQIATLFWWMAGGAAVIWLSVTGLFIYATRIHPHPHPRRMGLLIIGGGVVVPTVVLGLLLSYGLAMLPGLVAPAPEGSLRIHVSGEQWWWRVRYETPAGETVESANEIHLPVGEPVEFLLSSPDVIHSFWIPSLGGKIDMIPGRINRLRLDPTRTGTFRGACAEYCGESHTLMAFMVVVHEKPEFDEWLAAHRAPAVSVFEPPAKGGRQVFLSAGCGACHAVRGTNADGVVGPDLTHVGSRLSLGAGTIPAARDDFHRWVAKPKAIKPGVHMPSFGMLPPDDLSALAAYLEALD